MNVSLAFLIFEVIEQRRYHGLLPQPVSAGLIGVMMPKKEPMAMGRKSCDESFKDIACMRVTGQKPPEGEVSEKRSIYLGALDTILGLNIEASSDAPSAV